MKFLKPIINDADGSVKSVILNGSSPYIHWFDAPGSTGLYHYKRLIIYAPESYVTCTLPSDSPFDIYVPGVLSSSQSDIDLADVQDSVLRKTLTQYSDVYATFFIVVCLDEAGEYIENMTVNIGGVEEVVNIGIEVHEENELLKGNLINKGIEIPEDIEKAIYDTDVYEENIDWVLMNDKWRELLNNYMDTLACKGNYKSLANSLKWFGYGDLVVINECWKRETQDGVKLTEKPLTLYMEDWCKEILSSSAKTTYLTLKHAADAGYIDNGGIYRNDPPHDTYPPDSEYYELQPFEYNYETLIGDYAVKWSKQEMAMKMYLLGRFFETYFMPVHLDLLISSVESIIYDVPYTVLTAGYSEQESDWTNIGDEGDVEISIVNPSAAKGFDNVSKMKQVEVYGCSFWEASSSDDMLNEVLFGFGPQMNEGNVGSSLIGHPFLGVTDHARMGDIPLANAGLSTWALTKSRFKGIGSLVDFHYKSNYNVSKITATTNINHPEDDVWERTYDVSTVLDEFISGCNSLILIQKPGEYFITFDVEYTKNGNALHYIKTFYLKVLDNTSASLKYYGLEYDKPKISNATEVDFMNTLFNSPEDPQHAFDALIGSQHSVKDKVVVGKFNIRREIHGMDSKTPRLTKCKLLNITAGDPWELGTIVSNDERYNIETNNVSTTTKTTGYLWDNRWYKIDVAAIDSPRTPASGLYNCGKYEVCAGDKIILTTTVASNNGVCAYGLTNSNSEVLQYSPINQSQQGTVINVTENGYLYVNCHDSGLDDFFVYIVHAAGDTGSPEPNWFVIPSYDGTQALCIPLKSYNSKFMNDDIWMYGRTYTSRPVYCFIEGWHKGIEIPKLGRKIQLANNTPVYIKHEVYLDDDLIEMSNAKYEWIIRSLKTGDDLCVPVSNANPYIVSYTNDPTPTGSFLVNVKWNWGEQHGMSELTPFVYV